MRLYSYVVARDYGFAPNPFFGVCTLATCKPMIRKYAKLGDWVVGTGSKQRNRHHHLVYAMHVTDVITFDKYWSHPTYRKKQPNLRGSLKQAYGDNIYCRTAVGGWQQLDSHHSHEDGRINEKNVARDTRVNRVLVAQRFAYLGGEDLRIPETFHGIIHAGRGHKCRFPEALVQEFIAWFESLELQGLIGRPLDWPSREGRRDA